MSAFSKLVRNISKPIAAIAPFVPGGKPLALGAGIIASDTARRVEEERQAIAEKDFRERLSMSYPSLGQRYGGTSVTGTNTIGVQNSGFGSSFGNFLDNFNRNVINPGVDFASSIGRLFGGGSRPQNAAERSAVTTITNVGAQETQGSSTQNAGLLPGLGALGSRALQLLKTPGGQLALGGGAALGFMGGSGGSQRRITRKMKSQARQVLNITNGDLGAAADILNISTDELVFVLLKRFRNDGAMVTKAAIRKTRKTIRKLHMMRSILDDVSRKTPSRRRTSATFSRKGTVTSRI